MVKQLQSRLAIAILFTGLLVLAYLITRLVSGPIDFLYGSANGFTGIRSVADIAAIIAAVFLLITALMLAVPTAFRPAGRFQRVLGVLPLYLSALTLFTAIASLLNIGTTGTVFRVGMAMLTLSATAIILFTLLSVIAVTITAVNVNFSERTLTFATRMMGVTLVPTVVAAVAMLISIGIVATSQPRSLSGGPGGPGGNAGPTAQGTASASGTQAAQDPGAQAGGPSAQGTASAPGTQAAQAGGSAPGGSSQASGPGAQGTASASGTQAAQSGSAGQGGGNQGGGPGGPGGGPGGGSGNFVTLFNIGGGLVALFAVIALVSAAGGVIALRKASSATGQAEGSAAPINYGHEARSVLVSVVGISIVAFVVIQFVPVTRDNPPVQAAVQWDSPQTQQLWQRACANCHSNTTEWPWYSYIAPSSWLLTIHVHNARSEFNMSELSNVPTFVKSMFPNQAEQNIKSGAMPPSDFLLMHPEARLTDTEKQQLIEGLKNTLSKQ